MILMSESQEKSKWEMTGKSAILVAPHSATHGRLQDQGSHEVDPINRSHSELVKFHGPFDVVYSTVLLRIGAMCDDDQGSFNS